MQSDLTTSFLVLLEPFYAATIRSHHFYQSHVTLNSRVYKLVPELLFWECTFSHNRLHAWGTCNHGELFNWVKYCVNNSNSCYDSMNWRMYNNILVLMFMVMVAFSSLRCSYSAIIVAKASGLCRIYTRPSVLDFTFLVTVLPGLWAFLSLIKFPLRPRDQ